MKIIAFDLGTTWARAEAVCKHPADDELPFHATLLGKHRTEKLGHWENQCQALGLKRADCVIYERPFCRGMAATRLLWGMAGVLEAVAHNVGVAVIDVTPAEIKKWATGSGSAKKPDMIEAARRLGYRGHNEHEADAYCLLKFAQATLTKE